MIGPTQTSDVVIVGAGLIGAAVAYESARRGLRVLVLDRAERSAEGATRWSQAGLSWLSAVKQADVSALCREGLARHRTLSAELDAETGFRPLPLLTLAREEGALSRLAELLDVGRGQGFEGQLVSQDDLRRLEPALAADAALGGALCQQGHADPARLTRAWLSAAERLGATVRCGVAVDQLAVVDGRCVAVETSDGSVQSEQVVVAAGAWTRSLLRQAGLEVPILHTHAEILESAPLPPLLSHFVGVAEPARAELELAMAAPELRPRWDGHAAVELLPAAAQFGVVQFADGRLRLGQVSRAVPGFLERPRPEGEAAIRALARTIVPTLADLPATLQGCPVAISADRRPVAGPLAEVPNLVVAAGFDSPVIYAPALAERLATGLAIGFGDDFAPFRPDRSS